MKLQKSHFPFKICSDPQCFKSPNEPFQESGVLGTVPTNVNARILLPNPLLSGAF